MSETITVWISLYALSKGVYQKEAELLSQGMIKVPGQYGGQYFHTEGKEWHRTKDSAITRAEAMRAKKLEALRKQLKRIEAMTFRQP